MTAPKLIPKSIKPKTSLPTIPAPKVSPTTPAVPTDPGPPPMDNGPAFHDWCMRQSRWKQHKAHEKAGQKYMEACLRLGERRLVDPKGIRKAVIATLKFVIENYAYENGIPDLEDKVTNDLDAFLQEDAILAILRGEG